MASNATDATVHEQLLLLRDMTERTGVLHEAQKLQLSIWPRVAIAHCQVSEVEPKIEHDADGRATSKTLIVRAWTRGPAPKNLDQCVRLLKTWIAELLGKGWEIKVEYIPMNGKTKKKARR